MLFIANLLILFALAKAVSHSFQPYKAALTYAIVLTVLALLLRSDVSPGTILGFGVLKFGLALPYFYLLNMFEDTFFMWLLIFIGGGVLLGMI